MKKTVHLNELKAPYYLEDTVRYVGFLGIRFKPIGKYYRGRCPFHSDRHPSFYLHHARGSVRFTCFSNKCDGSWDIFALIQKIEGCDFVDAVKKFGHHANVDEVILPRGRRVKIDG